MRTAVALSVALALAANAAVFAAPAGLAKRPAAPIVAAASDLSFALAEIAERFAAERGERVTLVFGSSGTLAAQIRNGAPFELFLAADEALVALLADAGLTRDRGKPYAIGRLVLFAPHGSPLVPRDGLAGLARLLERGLDQRRFAIANPEHAPYGRAAEAALRKHGLLPGLRRHLVLGDNVSQAAQFAATGGAIGGLVAYSLARSPALADRGSFELVPESDHPPLVQRQVLLRRAGPVAERFYHYLGQEAARAILDRYGFTLPAAATPP